MKKSLTLKRRGRPPAGIHAASAAERKRASRLRMIAAGNVEVTVWIPQSDLAVFDAMAVIRKQSRAEALQALLVQAAERLRDAFEMADKLYEHGASDQQVDQVLEVDLPGAPGANEKGKG